MQHNYEYIVSITESAIKNNDIDGNELAFLNMHKKAFEQDYKKMMDLKDRWSAAEKALEEKGLIKTYAQKDKILLKIKAVAEFKKLTKKNTYNLMSLKDFVECVENGGFIDYDGWGYLVIDGMQVDNSCTSISYSNFEIDDEEFSFEDLLKITTVDIKVNWVNK